MKKSIIILAVFFMLLGICNVRAQKLSNTHISRSYKIVSDPQKSNFELWQLANIKEWTVDSSIKQKSFPLERNWDKIKISFVQFDSELETDEVLNRIRKLGYAPATISHALALASQRPKLFSKYFFMTFLGTHGYLDHPTDNKREYTVMFTGEYEPENRLITLFAYKKQWEPGTKFAIYKVK